MGRLTEIDEKPEDERDRHNVPSIRDQAALQNGDRQPIDTHSRTLP
jgi:hypothetical protein